MQKNFAIALIAISTLFSAIHHGALATETARNQQPNDTAAWVIESGTASYYGKGFHGHTSASGLRYDQMSLTAAHRWLPFGTKVRVTLAGTTRSVVVTITDRVDCGQRIVDLSVAAARQLGMINRGLATVTLAPA